jgi:hypothetical protein
MAPCNKGDDAIMTTAKTPENQRWQQCHHYEGNNTSLTTATTPSLQGQQHYHNNNKDTWTAKTPAHQHWQHHCNEGNNTSLTTAKNLHINDGNDSIVRRAMAPA